MARKNKKAAGAASKASSKKKKASGAAPPKQQQEREAPPPAREQMQNTASWGGVPPADAFDKIRRFPPPGHMTQQQEAEAEPAKGKQKKKKKAKGKQDASPAKTGKKKTANPARRRRQRRIAAIAVIVVLIAAGSWFSVSVLFKINKYDVQGEVPYTQEQVVEAFGHSIGDNLYGFSVKNAEERVEAALPYIEEASIRRRPPSTVLFRLTPAVETYYIPWQAGFAVLSAGGKVLRQTEEEPLDLVQIKGLGCLVVEEGKPLALDEEAASKAAALADEVAKRLQAEAASRGDIYIPPEESEPEMPIAEGEPEGGEEEEDSSSSQGEFQEDYVAGQETRPPEDTAGEPLSEEDQVLVENGAAAESFEVLWTLIDTLKEYGVEDVRWLDVSDPLDMQFNWQDRVTVKLGAKSGMDEKMTALMVLLTDPAQGLSETDRGTLDLTYYQTNKNIYFAQE